MDALSPAQMLGLHRKLDAIVAVLALIGSPVCFFYGLRGYKFRFLYMGFWEMLLYAGSIGLGGGLCLYASKMLWPPGSAG